MTLALIAGTGGLPVALMARLNPAPLVCALDGFVPDVPADVTFRIEHLGSFLDDLRARGVTQICMAGAIRRPDIDPGAIDPLTMPLVPRIAAAIAQGDDAALRIVIAIFEEQGFVVRAAHDIAPDLLPPAGVLTKVQPGPTHSRDAAVGQDCIVRLGAADQGQACLVNQGRVIATEGPDGTAAMIGGAAGESDLLTSAFDAVVDLLAGPVAADERTGAILYKAPKPGQDRRADLPVIGPDTADQAMAAGLAGIVIAAGGVMVLDLDAVISRLDAAGLFLWVRPEDAP